MCLQNLVKERLVRMVSRKSRKQKRAQAAIQRKVALPGTVTEAADGYANAAAFLGEESELMRAGTFQRSNLTRDVELLTTAYRESWIVKRIIDMPCEDMTRAWYTLSTGLSGKAVHELYRLEARHSVKQEMTNAIRWARLYGGALAVMVIKGEEEMLEAEEVVLEI